MKSHSISELSVTNNQDQILIVGPLTQDTVMVALDKTTLFLVNNTSMNINLEAVTDCDSAGVAFIVELLRQGKRKQTQLTFTGMPEHMRDLAAVGGLAELIALEK